MRVQHSHRHVTPFVPVFVACIAAACNGSDRRGADDDGVRGFAPDSFVAPARAASSSGATFADTARHAAAPSRRDTRPQGAGVVIAGSPSGLTLSGDAVQPSGGATSGQVASGQGATNGGAAPPVAPAQQPETPTIIVNDPAAPAAAPTPTPASPSTPTPTPPKSTPPGNLPGVVARPGPDAPKHPTPQLPKVGVVRHPQPGTSDTASTRPCGSTGTSDTASRSPCGQPGTSDTAAAPRRAPALLPGSRNRPVIPLTPQGVSSSPPPRQVREDMTARAPTRTTIPPRTTPAATRKP